MMDHSATRHAAVAASTAAALVLALAGFTAGCNRGSEPDVPTPDETAPTPSIEPMEGSGTGMPTAPEAAPPTPTREVAPVVDRRPDVEANRELAARLGLAPPDPLLVSDLLTRADVRELAGFRGELLETSLEGIEPSPSYNTIRLQADGGYGFALQLWQFDEVRQLSAHYRRLNETYFDSQVDESGVANEAFAALFQGIRHYAFLHRASKSVAVLTCAEDLCDPTQIRGLAQRVANRL